MDKRRRQQLKLLCLAVFAACVFFMAREYGKSVRNEALQAELKALTETEKMEESAGQADSEKAEGDKPGQSRLEKAEGDKAGQSRLEEAEGDKAGQNDPEEAEGDIAGQNGPEEAEGDKAGQTDPDKAGEYAARQSDHDPGNINDNNVILRKYEKLYSENTDLAGWLSVEGTRIDYPVMQCADDDEYYLHHDFYGEDSKYGCLYVRGRADVGAGTNFIIYGHNMKDGSMFGDLDFYQKESFFTEHPEISFDTLYEERIYDIMAVFRSQVYRENEDVFKYYQFYEAETEEEFEDFYKNIKELSLYDTKVEAEFGDRFLTLSTCAYHVEDGRFVVVAKLRRTEG